MLLIILAAALLQPMVHAGSQPDCIVTIQQGDYFASCDNHGLQEILPGMPRVFSALGFSFNRLTRLTDQFVTDDCDSIQTFQLSEQNSTLWCSWFPNMMYLDFSYNDIENISSYFLSGMMYLRSVDLANNKLEDLHPRVFSSNRLLFYIDISGNKIKFIHPGVFKNLRYLQVLLIANNRIINLHQETFDGLVSLRTLWLNNNTISSLHQDLFKNLSNLRAFKVDHNRLECISHEILLRMPYLEAFKASHNRIRFLSPTIFSNNPTLKVVEFSYNSIRKLSKFTFLDLVKMSIVDFSFNSIEWLYLSYLPVSVKSSNEVNVIDMDTDICLDDIGVENPCFTSYENNVKGNDIFHNLDFSYNKLRYLRFSDTKIAHMLELANISFAGNYGLQMKAKFFRKERFVTRLNLDGSNINWKNLTLINEILDLPYFNTLSVKGSEICEYYSRELMMSIFNPNKRVNIICEGHKIIEPLTNSQTLAGRGESFTHEFTSELEVPVHTDNASTTECLEDDPFDDTNNLCDLECECYVNSTLKTKKINTSRFQYSCDYTLDCSYYSFLIFPEIKHSYRCILLSHNNVNDIAGEYFQFSNETKLLDMSHNCLNDLPDKLFYPLASLEALHLDNNNLSSLNPGIFNNLTELAVLTLHENRISAYDAYIFAESPLLTLISVDFFNLDKLHDITFRNQISLRILHARGCTSLTVNRTIATKKFLENLCGVQSLSLIGFNLSVHFTGKALCSKSLEYLYLKDNYLPFISNDVFWGLNNVKGLILQHNDIYKLGKNSFRNLTNVLAIDLSHNAIESIDNHLFSYTQQLRDLNISHNKISCVSSMLFKNLTLLVSLDLSYNNLWTDSNTFSMLYSLKALFLNNNNMTSKPFSSNAYSTKCLKENISDSFLSLDLSSTNSISLPQRKYQIENINISVNALEVIVNTTFFNMPFLMDVAASYNRIYQIDNDTFKYTKKLKNLNLDNNALVSINRSTFRNLTALQSLILHKNHIEFIEHGAFLDLMQLVQLVLSYNRLKMFDPSILPVGGPLKMLSLHSNNMSLTNSSVWKLPFLQTFYLGNNPLKQVIVDDFYSLQSVLILALENTNIHKFDTTAFLRLQELQILQLKRGCVHSLSPFHFHNLLNLVALDISMPTRDTCIAGTDNILGWKNITLINFLFEHPHLQYLLLAGHEICDELYMDQIIDTLFLSERWKIVVCLEQKLPETILTPDSYIFSRTMQIAW